MNRSFHPFFSKQNSLRTQLEQLQEQYEEEKRHRLACEQTCQEQTVERTQLIEDQVKLADRITALLEQCHNFQARNADLEDEIARLKHKKLPPREKV